MRFRNLTGATALVAALMMAIGGAAAFDDLKYPDLKGQWRRVGAVPNTSVTLNPYRRERCMQELAFQLARDLLSRWHRR
jgi:hypothetical protein